MSFSKWDFQVRTTLGAAISDRNRWMQEQAVLGNDYRLLMALLQCIQAWKPDIDQEKLNKLKMFIIHVGHAEWLLRDEITDMGIKLGDIAATHRADEIAEQLD